MDPINNTEPEEHLEEYSLEKQDVRERVNSLVHALQAFVFSMVSIREEIDYEGTPARVEEGIKFRGFNVWVLIFSIFIASIGLNSNSTAIIIGAMLISPLMGPIVGVGFSLGTNRFGMLKRSFSNFFIMVGVALFTSWFYFLLTPLDKADTEILARTAPTILDVLVAVFGGFAGAIAGMRKKNGLTVIPGVAIATALMPPLCTVGYGIATWQPEFAFGAFYLFMLNSVIISVATTVFVRFARFPLYTFVNKRKESKAKIWIFAFTVLLIGPSVWFFVTATQKSIYETNASHYLEEVTKQPSSFVISKNVAYKTDSVPRIEILFGGKTIADSTIENWKSKLFEYGIEATELIIIQDIHDEQLSATIKDLEQNSTNQVEQNKSILNTLMAEKAADNARKDSVINSLSIAIFKSDSVRMEYKQISIELRTMYKGINKMAFGKVSEDTQGAIQSMPVLFINWASNVGASSRKYRTKKIQEWLPVRTQDSTIVVRQYTP